MRLGVVPDSSDTPSGFEKFTGRVAIPNICASGHVVGLKFRDVTGESRMKYHQPVGQVQRLFNLRALDRVADTVAITEGEIDAISLESLGVPAIAVPGADSWKSHHWRVLEGVPRIVMFVDADEVRHRPNKRTGEMEEWRPGEELLKRVQADLDVIPVRAPAPHKDCNEALVNGLGADLRRIALGKDAS